MPNSLQPHGLQHARLPRPSLSLSLLKPYPLSWWCYLIISSSTALFSLCLPSSPASGSFPVSWLPSSGGQSIRASALASVLPPGLISFRIWSPCGKETLNSLLYYHNSKFITQPSLWSNFLSVPDYWKSHSFDYMIFVSKMMSFLFRMLSRFVIFHSLLWPTQKL